MAQASQTQRAPAAPEACSQPPHQAVSFSKEKMADVVSKLEMDCDIKVEVAQDKVSGRNVVKIFTADGRRQISQIPPKGVLKLSQNLHEFVTAGGLVAAWA
jgi:uncharacterized FlaG/YvyC family protein